MNICELRPNGKNLVPGYSMSFGKLSQCPVSQISPFRRIHEFGALPASRP